MAGLLATAARDGAAIRVVCATRGERGPRPPSRTLEELAAIRSRELEASCAILGAPAPTWLDLPDGELAAIERPALARALASALARHRPDAVVSFGEDGGYGHRDHVAVAAALPAAALALEPPPRVLAAAFPRGLFAPLCRRLRRLRRSPIDPDVTPVELGIERHRADLIVNVEPVAAIKREVAAAHRSQRLSGHEDEFLAPGLLAKLCREEWYTTGPGGGP